MKKYAHHFPPRGRLCLCLLQGGLGQDVVRFPSDYTINYGLRQVLEYDPMNINGIDVVDKFDFFSTLRFTIEVHDGKMTHLEFSNGEVPFSPFAFEVPDGVVECEFDTDALAQRAGASRARAT